MARAKPKKRVVGRPFIKGKDPRRHIFTNEERKRGYENMQLNMLDTHPDWFCTWHQRHISGCFLKHRNPLWFEVRKLQGQVKKRSSEKA